MKIYDKIESFELDAAKVHKLTTETKNKRMSKEDQEKTANLPGLRYKQDFKRRVLLGGELSFLEAKYVVREMLTFDKWMVKYYEVVNFPKVVFFDTVYQAEKFFNRATKEGRGMSGGKLMAKRMEFYGPSEYIYANRPELGAWRSELYEPDGIEYLYG
jgi:hypothetical protein